jgi:HK97 family phage major capsid protein
MLESIKIQRRQSEIRQSLAALVGKTTPTEDETRSMETLDSEYRSNETRYRASLIAEDSERRDAKGELETRGDKEYADMLGKFEMRQIAAALDEGKALSGATKEIVDEMRSKGGYQGIPVPFAVLEKRVGETIASGVTTPERTAPIADRLFADSVAARLGVSMVNIDHGELVYPVATAGAVTGWQATETGDVGAASAFATAEPALKPDQTLGAQMVITRKALKQSGEGLEQAIRRDLNAAIGVALDKAVFYGTGASGQPLGIIQGAGTYGIVSTDMAAAAPTWAAFRTELVAFMAANAISSPSMVRIGWAPGVWSDMEGGIFDVGSGVTELDRMNKTVPMSNIATSSQFTAGHAILTTNAGGLPPAFLGLFGGLDLIRDVVTMAGSGALKLTGLVTADVQVARAAQTRVLTNFG